MVESDLHYFQEVFTDSTKYYTAFTEEAAQQCRQSKQMEQQQCKLQSPQQAIWQAAVIVRGLRADPRIDSALAALESLFRTVQGEQAQQTGHPAPPPTGAEPPKQPASQPLASRNHLEPTPPPAMAPAGPIICTSCWSVSCRCKPLSTACDTAVSDMVVDQERGAKRSCKEAALPERSSGGQSLPGALLVDAAGNAVPTSSTSQSTDAGADSQKPEQAPAKQASGGADCKELEGGSAEDSQAEAMVVELGGIPPPTASAVEAPTGGPCKPGDGSGVPETYAKADKVADEAEKEESRSSFSSLVKATCSMRTHPY